MMTRTEERLADALAARAAAIRPEALRPLIGRPKLGRAPAWRWLAPLAAATSIALVAALMTALGRGSSSAPGMGNVPRYYVWPASSGDAVVHLQVRSTATGAVVARVPDPTLAGGPGWGWFGAQAGFQTYVALAACRGCRRSPMYRFHLDREGRVTHMSIITDRTVPAGAGEFRLSPDGLELAYVMTTKLHGRPAPTIAIMNLHTGRTAFFKGGLSRRGVVTLLRSPAWPRDGRFLTFAVTFCHRSPAPGRAPCSPWTVRSLDPSEHGGLLTSGSVLLATHAPANYLIPYTLAIDPAGTGILRMSYETSADTLVQIDRLTSINLATGKRTVVRRWVGQDTMALYPMGGVVFILSRPGPADRFSAKLRVIGLVGSSGKYQSIPVSPDSG